MAEGGEREVSLEDRMEELSQAGCYEEWEGWSSLSVSQRSTPLSHEGACCEGETCALRRELSAERARGAAAARAHAARLAELHAVIAELLRRQHAHIPEEPHTDTDDCESTTQAIAELQLDLSEKETSDYAGQESSVSTHTHTDRADAVDSGQGADKLTHSLSESEGVCVRCPPPPPPPPPPPLFVQQTHTPGVCLRRANRVRLRTASEPAHTHTDTLRGCAPVLCELVGGEPDTLRDTLAAAAPDLLVSALVACGARVTRLAADVHTLQTALASARHHNEKMWSWSMRQEASLVSVCAALRAADRAIETYDVLLALAEARDEQQTGAAAEVARRVLADEAECEGALVPPGPWQRAPPAHPAPPAPPLSHAHTDTALRELAAALKRETVAARDLARAHTLHSHTDGCESVCECEAAVREQEAAETLERRALALHTLQYNQSVRERESPARVHSATKHKHTLP